MKILVTGANGQLGRHVGNALKNSSWDFRLCSHSQLDICCKRTIQNIVTSYQPDIIINAAAFTDVGKAEINVEQAYAVNSLGAENLANAAATIDAAIFHVSTDYVFSGDKPGAYSEDDEASPLNIYGASKYAGELAIINANKRHIILRTSWIFSEYQTNFVKTMLRLAQTQGRLTVVADQFGGPTYAGDIANTILKIITHYQKHEGLPWGVYHYSGCPYVSWYDFAVEIFQQISIHPVTNSTAPTIKPISTAEYAAPIKRPMNSCLDCEKIKNTFNVELSNWKNALKKVNWQPSDEND